MRLLYAEECNDYGLLHRAPRSTHACRGGIERLRGAGLIHACASHTKCYADSPTPRVLEKLSVLAIVKFTFHYSCAINYFTGTDIWTRMQTLLQSHDARRNQKGNNAKFISACNTYLVLSSYILTLYILTYAYLYRDERYKYPPESFRSTVAVMDWYWWCRPIMFEVSFYCSVSPTAVNWWIYATADHFSRHDQLILPNFITAVLSPISTVIHISDICNSFGFVRSVRIIIWYLSIDSTESREVRCLLKTRLLIRQQITYLQVLDWHYSGNICISFMTLLEIVNR